MTSENVVKAIRIAQAFMLSVNPSVQRINEVDRLSPESGLDDDDTLSSFF